MNESQTYFTYSMEYLFLYQPQIGHVIVALVLGIIGIVLLRWILYITSGLLLLKKEAKALEKKKWVLSDLILMKDIQTELEHEIEQATLKATFQG